MDTQRQEICYPDSPKIGKFSHLREVLQDGRNAPWLKVLFGLCVVLDAYPDESGRGTEYIAASDLFQALKEGEEIPRYRIELATNMRFENPEFEARRLGNATFGFAAVRQNIVRVPALSMRTTAHAFH